ncbi:MAG: DUF4290 domain-containing protein [Bacteroidales bacterium]|nr:DUF4290 domain-containing protein [Bacteroidales bacterium]
MDYNTNREQLVLPEYGRHVQKMIEAVKGIEDKEQRNKQITAVVNVMALLNPSLKEFPDYKRKLWDHVYMIAGYDLDVDSPYPAPEKPAAVDGPNPIPINKTQIKATCYGRNIENMIDLVAGIEDETVKNTMIRNLARYMRQQYLIWNKDSVADITILKDMQMLSQGRLEVPMDMELGPVQGEFSKPRAYEAAKQPQQFGKKNRKKKHKPNQQNG